MCSCHYMDCSGSDLSILVPMLQRLFLWLERIEVQVKYSITFYFGPNDTEWWIQKINPIIKLSHLEFHGSYILYFEITRFVLSLQENFLCWQQIIHFSPLKIMNPSYHIHLHLLGFFRTKVMIFKVCLPFHQVALNWMASVISLLYTPPRWRGRWTLKHMKFGPKVSKEV